MVLLLRPHACREPRRQARLGRPLAHDLVRPESGIGGADTQYRLASTVVQDRDSSHYGLLCCWRDGPAILPHPGPRCSLVAWLPRRMVAPVRTSPDPVS